MVNKIILITLLIISGISLIGHTYEIPAHKQIVLEAAEIWTEMPQEIFDHLSGENKVDFRCLANYDLGDDIYVASAEEDLEDNMIFCRTLSEHTDTNEGLNGFLEHFWNPDYPYTTRDGFLQRGYNCRAGSGFYNLGLGDEIPSSLGPACGSHFDSNYRLAQDLWDNKVIPFYKSGMIGEAYYWLGRGAHLLSDLGVPAHVQLRPHDPLISSKDLYEGFVTAKIVKKYSGNLFRGREYLVDCLPNIPCDFDWRQIHPSSPKLFKLFWYTAQKTEYFAGANREKREGQPISFGNDIYAFLNGTTHQFLPNLWSGEAFPFGDPGLLLVSNKRVVDTRLQLMANALVPHTLKAVAGLYRLFWEETHREEEPPEGNAKFVSVFSGDPGLPGDGIVAGIGGDSLAWRGSIFEFAELVPVSEFPDGFTITVFPFSDIPISGIQVNFVSSVLPSPPCVAGHSSNAELGPLFNEVQGYARYISSQTIQNLIDIVVRNNPQACAGLTLDNFVLQGFYAYGRVNGVGTPLTEIDAVAIGLGENSFP